MKSPRHKYPLGAVQTGAGRQVSQQSPGQRHAAVIETVGDLVLDGDLEAAMDAVRRALVAKTTIRAPKKRDEKTGERTTPHVNDYMIVDDTMAQLAAVRLLWEFKFVKPATVLELPPPPDPNAGKPATRDDLIAQLRASKIDPSSIMAAWLNAAKKVEAEGPLPPDVAAKVEEVKQATEQLAVIEV